MIGVIAVGGTATAGVITASAAIAATTGTADAGEIAAGGTTISRGTARLTVTLMVTIAGIMENMGMAITVGMAGIITNFLATNENGTV